MITKEIIIKNISKNGKYITKNFLNENSCTQQECFDILYPEKIKKCKYCNNITTFVNFSFGYKDICDCKECKHKIVSKLLGKLVWKNMVLKIFLN